MSLSIPDNMRFQGVNGFNLPDLEKAEPVLSSFARWKKQRLGRYTSSQFGKIKIAKSGKNKGGLTDTSKTYMNQILAELMTGEPQDNVKAKALQYGIDNEPIAIKAYEKAKGVKVKKGKFRLIPRFNLGGGTPDGLIGNDGVIEVKCPYISTNHVKTVVTKKVPDIYKDQITGHLLVTGRKWVDFVSFDPRNKIKSLMIIRVERNENDIQELMERIQLFDKTLKAEMKKLGVKRKVEMKA